MSSPSYVTPYEQVIEYFQDPIVGEFVAEALDYLDYQSRIEDIICRPRRVRFSDVEEFVDGSADNPVDLSEIEDEPNSS